METCGIEWLAAGSLCLPSCIFRGWFGGFVYQGWWILAESFISRSASGLWA